MQASVQDGWSARIRGTPCEMCAVCPQPRSQRCKIVGLRLCSPLGGRVPGTFSFNEQRCLHRRLHLSYYSSKHLTLVLLFLSPAQSSKASQRLMAPFWIFNLQATYNEMAHMPHPSSSSRF